MGQIQWLVDVYCQTPQVGVRLHRSQLHPSKVSATAYCIRSYMCRPDMTYVLSRLELLPRSPNNCDWVSEAYAHKQQVAKYGSLDLPPKVVR